jgi:hypothetical protein
VRACFPTIMGLPFQGSPMIDPIVERSSLFGPRRRWGARIRVCRIRPIAIQAVDRGHDYGVAVSSRRPSDFGQTSPVDGNRYSNSIVEEVDLCSPTYSCQGKAGFESLIRAIGEKVNEIIESPDAKGGGGSGDHPPLGCPVSARRASRADNPLILESRSVKRCW